jgi:putative transposase
MLPKRKSLPHDIPSWVKDDAVFFITLCALPRGVNQLCSPEVGRAVQESVAFREERNECWFHLLLLMPDHLHGFVSFPPSTVLQNFVKQWKRHLAKACGIRWQRGFFDHRLRNDENYEEKALYVRNNPVRAGLCLESRDWPYKWEKGEFGWGAFPER